MKITLLCMGGMSTGLLVQRMQQYATQTGQLADISAWGMNEMADHVQGSDIILLGPQIGYQKDEIQQKYPQIPVQVIDMMDYGMMNGEKVFNDTLNYLK